jgi:hypothetical protein
MSKDRTRQALALSARLSRPSSVALPGYTAGEIASLEAEAARAVANGHPNGAATSAHLVLEAGRLSGYVQDKHTLVRFGGGAVAVSTHV